MTFLSATHNATHAEKFCKVLIFLLFWSNLQIVLLYDLTTTTTADLSVQATVGLFQIISLTSQMNNLIRALNMCEIALINPKLTYKLQQKDRLDDDLLLSTA